VTERLHTLQISPHGRTLQASPARSILDAALHAGLNLPHSCKSGHCASCRARLISGRIRYPHGRPLGLSAVEESQGFILTCQAQPLTDVAIEARLIARVGEAEIKTLPCRIASTHPLAPDVLQVMLRLPAVETLAFLPGQYLDVLLEDGSRRSFSIASPPHDAGLLELHVRRAPGGRFTERLFAAPAAGALLRIEGPLGSFIYSESARPAILIAGGTGFAPLKSMLRQALERGSSRELHVYWGARTPVDLYESALLEEWTRRHPRLRYTPVLSAAEGDAGAGPDAVPYRRGWVHEAVLQDHASLERHEVYAAGPPAMIEAIRASFPVRGLASDALNFDSFDYAQSAG